MEKNKYYQVDNVFMYSYELREYGNAFAIEPLVRVLSNFRNTHIWFFAEPIDGYFINMGIVFTIGYLEKIPLHDLQSVIATGGAERINKNMQLDLMRYPIVDKKDAEYFKNTIRYRIMRTEILQEYETLLQAYDIRYNIVWKSTELPEKVTYKVLEWRLPYATMPTLTNGGVPPTREYEVMSAKKALELETKLLQDRNVFKVRIGVEFKRSKRWKKPRH